MKTAVSVPDEIFERAERLVRRSRVSRSELYSRALREYIARHAPDEVTERLNAVVSEVQGDGDEFAGEASRRTLERAEW